MTKLETLKALKKLCNGIEFNDEKFDALVQVIRYIELSYEPTLINNMGEE